MLEQYEDAKGKQFVRFIYKGQDRLLPSLSQMVHLDGWRNVRKWQQHNRQLGIEERVMKEYTILIEEEPSAERAHKEQKKEEENVYRERMMLYPYEEFKVLSALLIPVNYKEECEV